MGKYRVRRKARTQQKVSIHKKIKKIPKLKVSDGIARNIWTHKNTLKKNYEAIGLAVGVNKNNASDIIPKTLEEEEQLIEKTEDPNFFDTVALPTDDLKITIPEEHLPHEARLSHAELSTLGELIKKHGYDYRKMERDIKVNRYQLTRKQLKKRIEIYYCKYKDTPLDPLNGQHEDITVDESESNLGNDSD